RSPRRIRDRTSGRPSRPPSDRSPRRTRGRTSGRPSRRPSAHRACRPPMRSSFRTWDPSASPWGIFPAPETKKRDGRSPSPFQTSIGRILAALSRVDELADALTALVPDLLVEFVTALTGDLLAAHAPDLLVELSAALAGDLLAAHAP